MTRPPCDDAATTVEDSATPVVIDVLANDSDPDNDAVLTVTAVTRAPTAPP